MAAWKKWVVVLSAGIISACSSTVSSGSPDALAEGSEEACVPVSCFQLGRFCGTSSDGCGGTVDCGTCGNGGACNELGYCCGGPSDPCAPPVHAGGDLEFAIVRSGLEADGFNSVDADLMGNIFALRNSGGRSLLESFTAESMATNKAAFSIDLNGTAGAVALAPTLDRAYVSSIADVRSLAAGATEMTFTKAGVQLGTAQNFSGEAARGFMAVGYTNNRAFADASQRLTVRDANDRLMFTMDEIPFAVNDAAFDIDGNVLAVGRTTANFDWRDTSWNGGQPFIVKFTRGGAVLWARNLNISGEFNDVSVTPNGYAAVSGTFANGGFTFADTMLESRAGVAGMVLGFNPTGSDRYAYFVGDVVGFPRVAMDQTGTAFVAFDRPNCGAMEIASLTFKGEVGWRKSYTNSGCTTSSRISGLTAARGSPVIVGRFGGMLDMTNVELDQDASSHGFLLKFKP